MGIQLSVSLIDLPGYYMHNFDFFTKIYTYMIIKVIHTFHKVHWYSKCLILKVC